MYIILKRPLSAPHGVSPTPWPHSVRQIHLIRDDRRRRTLERQRCGIGRFDTFAVCRVIEVVVGIEVEHVAFVFVADLAIAVVADRATHGVSPTPWPHSVRQIHLIRDDRRRRNLERQRCGIGRFDTFAVCRVIEVVVGIEVEHVAFVFVADLAIAVVADRALAVSSSQTWQSPLWQTVHLPFLHTVQFTLIHSAWAETSLTAQNTSQMLSTDSTVITAPITMPAMAMPLLFSCELLICTSAMIEMIRPAGAMRNDRMKPTIHMTFHLCCCSAMPYMPCGGT